MCGGKTLSSRCNKNRSRSNKRSRDANKTGHRGGSRCFARAVHEYVDPQTKEKPDAISFYKLTHYSSEKGWVSPHAEENYDKMMEMSMEPMEEGSTPLTAEEIRETVLGVRSGYIPGLGYGVMAPTRRVGYGPGEGVAASTLEINQLRDRAENAENELQELRLQNEQIRNHNEQVKEQQNAQQLQINYLMSVLGGITTSIPNNFSPVHPPSTPNSFSSMQLPSMPNSSMHLPSMPTSFSAMQPSSMPNNFTAILGEINNSMRNNFSGMN